MRDPGSNTEHFDVFLCHNSEDKVEIRQVADELSSRGLKPWLDEREIRPGQQWQVALEEQMLTIKTAAVFVGESGISPWQRMEIRTLIDQFVKRGCPIIPVILSSATERPDLPIFLQNFHWVDFRKNHPNAYEQLISGIIGKNADPVREKASVSVLLEPNQGDTEGRLQLPIANPPDKKQQEELGILRDRVQEYWVDGVLRQSLYHEVLISLGKRTMVEVVERPPWKYDIVGLPDHCRNVLPQDCNINTIFDATSLLLILGEPGSGKTTSLLELAAVLINRAKDNPKERIPIVLNLSSWQKEQSLGEWIAAELAAKYRIPKSIARTWVMQDYLVPLLDGLDEVQPANQPDCVAAINIFIEDDNPSGMVVCSRLMEYQWLPKKLKLNGAVCLEPLSLDDVNNFLIAGGSQLEGLQQAMSRDSVLQDLAQTPLMLSIMSLACEGADGKELVRQKDDSLELRRENIFRLYIERMFQRKNSIASPFSQDQAIHWLSWLARKMKEQSQSVFMVEQFQPHWLSSGGQRLVYESVTAMSVGLAVGSLVALSAGMVSALTLGVTFGVSILLGCRSVSAWKNGAASGVIIGLIFLGFFGRHPGYLLILLADVLLVSLGVQSLKEIRPVETIRWQAKLFWKKMVSGSLVGFLFGELYGLANRLSGDEIEKIDFWYGLGLFSGVFAGPFYGLFFGLIDSVSRVEKTIPNEGIILSAKNGLAMLVISVLMLVISVLIFELINGIFLHVPVELLFVILLFGLIVGLSRGGSAVVKHYALRLVLWLTGSTPIRFIPFLDYCAKLILLKKVGGGYMFIHRTLLEYFAALPLQDNTVKKVSPGPTS